MTQTATRKATKTVQVIARIQFKDDARKVVYKVRASNGRDTYETYFYDGRATSCTCPAHKPCYHMVQLEEKEAERAAILALSADLSAEAALRTAEAIVDGHMGDEAYEAWKRANGLDVPLTREEYEREFDPNGLGW